MKYILVTLLFATSVCSTMEKKSSVRLDQLKKQAEALAFKLREQALNSSREKRGSYQSLDAQKLDELRLQIQAHEQIASN